MIGRWREINAGDVYGSLTVIEEAIPHLSADGKKKRFFKCRCVCGREVEVSMPALTRNVRPTCGCGRYCKHSVRKPIEYNGESHYAPETCCFVPQTVNALMTRGAKIRGKVKSIGVTFRRNKYVARCNFGHKEAKLIGAFDNEQDAFEAYREAKKSYIEQLAHNLYSNGEITERVYYALLNYEIKQYD